MLTNSGPRLDIIAIVRGCLRPMTLALLEYGSPLERLAGDVIDCPIVLNKDATVDLPVGSGLGVEVSDEKVEQYRVADVTL